MTKNPKNPNHRTLLKIGIKYLYDFTAAIPLKCYGDWFSLLGLTAKTLTRSIA